MANYRDWRDLPGAGAAAPAQVLVPSPEQGPEADARPAPEVAGPAAVPVNPGAQQAGDAGSDASHALAVEDAAGANKGLGGRASSGSHGGSDGATPAQADEADGVALPEEISVLMAEQQRLKAELAAMTGKAPPSAEDQRQNLRFPVKAHTKESRIEERRLRLHDERLAMLRRRAAARSALTLRAGQEQEEARAREAQARRQQEWAAQRAQELAAEQAARAAANKLLRQRWQAAREAAIEAHAAQEKQFVRWQATQEEVRQMRRAQVERAQAQAQLAARQAQEAACARREQEARAAAQQVLLAQQAEDAAADQRMEENRLAAQQVLLAQQAEQAAANQRLEQNRSATQRDLLARRAAHKASSQRADEKRLAAQQQQLARRREERQLEARLDQRKKQAR